MTLLHTGLALSVQLEAVGVGWPQGGGWQVV